MLNGAIETQEECTFRAKVYGVMGTFSKSTVRGGQMSRKGKKGEDRKTRFRNDSSKKKLVMHASKYVVHNFSICIFREYSREVYFDD